MYTITFFIDRWRPGNSGTVGGGPRGPRGGCGTVQHHDAALWLYGPHQPDLWGRDQQGPAMFYEDLHEGPGGPARV